MRRVCAGRAELRSRPRRSVILVDLDRVCEEAALAFRTQAVQQRERLLRGVGADELRAATVRALAWVGWGRSGAERTCAKNVARTAASVSARRPGTERSAERMAGE